LLWLNVNIPAIFLLFRIYETMADDKSISYSPYIHFILFCTEVRHCITCHPEISHAFEMEWEYERNYTQSLTRLSGSLCLVLLSHECFTERVEGHLEVASTTNNRKLTPAWYHRGFEVSQQTEWFGHLHDWWAVIPAPAGITVWDIASCSDETLIRKCSLSQNIPPGVLRCWTLYQKNTVHTFFFVFLSHITTPTHFTLSFGHPNNIWQGIQICGLQ
jgi:hypothetical protein